MNPPPKNQPLTLDLLARAVDDALLERADVQFARLLLCEDRWRSILENEVPQRAQLLLRGIPVHLMHRDDLCIILDSAFGSYSFDSWSAFLQPEGHGEQSAMLEVDLGFETTRQVEDVLRSKTMVVSAIPNYAGRVSVPPGENRAALDDLIVTPGHDGGHWSLRGGLLVDSHDGKVTINSKYDSMSGNADVAELLARLYGVTVDVSELYKQSAQLQARALEQRERAIKLERLNGGPSERGPDHRRRLVILTAGDIRFILFALQHADLHTDEGMQAYPRMSEYQFMVDRLRAALPEGSPEPAT